MAWFRRGKKNEDVASQADEASRTGTGDAVPAGDARGGGDAEAKAQTVAVGSDAGTSTPEAQPEGQDARTAGPYDASEVTDSEGYLKLGSLWVPAFEGLVLTFEMDQSQSQVTAVQVVLGDSSLQLQAFAAPRSSGIWTEIRAEIAEGLRAQGGQALEEPGELGTELLVTAGGARMRFLGVDGPRWFLRGVLSGRAAEDPAAAAPLRAVFTHCVVDRGGEPMGPRELLTLTLPEEGEQPAAEEGPVGLDPFTRGPEITEIR